MRLPLASLACSLLPALASGQETGPADFEAGLERVERLAQQEKWAEARDGLLALLEEHAGAEHVLVRVPELLEELRNLSFWLEYEAPDPQALISGRLERYSRASGQIKLRYPEVKAGGILRSSRNDFVLEGGFTMHPAFFAGPYTIELRGERYPGSPLIAVAFDDTEGYFVTPGGGDSAGFIARVESGTSPDTLATKIQSVLELWEPYVIKVAVKAREIVLTCNGKSFLKARRERGSWGRFGIRDVSNTEVLVSGKVTSAWIDGLVDAAVQRDRSAWERSFDVEALLPVWLRRHLTAGYAQAPDYEVPGTTDPRIAEHWKRLATLIEREDYERGVEYLKALSLDETPEEFLCFALSVLYSKLDAPENALEPCERLLELQPGYPPGRILYASALDATGRSADAVRELESVIEEHPAMGEAYTELAALYLAAGEPQKAKEVVDRALLARVPPEGIAEVSSILVRALRGPDWSRVYEHESDHYRVASDMSNAICVEAASMLEEAFQLFNADLHRLVRERGPRERFPVFLFSGQAGYMAYAEDLFGSRPDSTAGLYSPPLKQLLIWNLPDRAQMMATIRHEGLHQYLDRALPRTPLWVNEGLAEYYETSDPSRGFNRAGAPNEGDLAVLLDTGWGWTRYEELVRLSPAEFMRKAELHYAQAWALFHYLLEGGREEEARFDALFDALLAGASDEEVAATLFEGLKKRELDLRVREHVRGLR